MIRAAPGLGVLRFLVCWPDGKQAGTPDQGTEPEPASEGLRGFQAGTGSDFVVFAFLRMRRLRAPDRGYRSKVRSQVTLKHPANGGNRQGEGHTEG